MPCAVADARLQAAEARAAFGVADHSDLEHDVAVAVDMRWGVAAPVEARECLDGRDRGRWRAVRQRGTPWVSALSSRASRWSPSAPAVGRAARLRVVAITSRRLLAAAIGPTVAAAVLGNVLVGRESQRWFRALRQPRFAVPFPVFVLVGGVYYLLLGVVRYRALERQNVSAARLGLIVLALNELWNLAFFAPRSTRNAFVGCLVFAVPLAALQMAVRDDRVATFALAPYSVWVLVYDVPWSYRLWRLNPS
jgi:translocator protein